MNINEIKDLITIAQEKGINENLFRKIILMYEHKIFTYKQIKKILNEIANKEDLNNYLKICAHIRKYIYVNNYLHSLESINDNLKNKIKEHPCVIEILDLNVLLHQHAISNETIIYKLLEKTNVEEIRFIINAIKEWLADAIFNKNKNLSLDKILDFVMDSQMSIQERKDVLNLCTMCSQEGFHRDSLDFSNIVSLNDLRFLYKKYCQIASYIVRLFLVLQLNLKIDFQKSETEMLQLVRAMHKLHDYGCSDTVLTDFWYGTCYAKEVLTQNNVEEEYFSILSHSEFIFSDKITKRLVELIRNGKQDAASALNIAFRNNGIKHNPVCRAFLLKQTDEEVILEASRAFKINRIRKDLSALEKLNTLTTNKEKISYCKNLMVHYGCLIIEDLLTAEENELYHDYDSYLSGRISLEKFSSQLEKVKNTNIELIRMKK